MHFRSKILISQRKLTPSQHAQTPESQNQKNFFSIFCRQKLLGKFFGQNPGFWGLIHVYDQFSGGQKWCLTPMSRLWKCPMKPLPKEFCTFEHQKLGTDQKTHLKLPKHQKSCKNWYMHFRSKIPISQRKLTPPQHAQTPESQNQKFFFSIFCRQKLLGKFFGQNPGFWGLIHVYDQISGGQKWSLTPHVQVMEMSYEAIVEGILHF